MDRRVLASRNSSNNRGVERRRSDGRKEHQSEVVRLPVYALAFSFKSLGPTKKPPSGGFIKFSTFCG